MEKSLPSNAVRWLLDFSTFENYTVAAFIISLAFFFFVLQLMASDRQEPGSNSLEARKMRLHLEKCVFLRYCGSFKVALKDTI